MSQFKPISRVPKSTMTYIKDEHIKFIESIRGQAGKDGIDGKDGHLGKDGIKGEKGLKGSQGTSGRDGARGPAGPQGEKGEKGDSIQGPQGEAGKDGRGIVRMFITRGDLYAVYTDGDEVNLGRVEGPQGIQGMRGRSGGMSPQSTTQKQGFIDYNDNSTALNPVVLSEDTWTVIPNDGLGVFTNKNYLPTNVTELMDTTTGKIDPTQLQLGDIIIIRNDFTVIPQTNNASLRFRYTLGGGAGAYTLEKRLGRLDEGSGIEYRFSLATDKIYMGDANTRDNHIGLEVKSSTPATLVNAGTVISVMKYEV